MLWPRLKELALAADRSVEITLGKSAGGPKIEHLTDRHAIFGLRRLAARESAAASPGPQRYDVLRGEALAEARRHGTEELWAQLLPNSNQILNHYDLDWNAALQAAGLPPRPRVTGRHNAETAAVVRWKGVPAPEAIKVFVLINDEWPSRTVMKKFMRDAGYTMARSDDDWTSYLEAARDLLVAEGRPLPPPTVIKRGRGIKRNFKLPPPGTFPESASPRGPWQKEQACVDAVARWLVGPPKPKKETRAAYLGFCVGKPDFPSPKVFEQHGGWSTILKKARAQARAKRGIETPAVGSKS
jgi:hypothetical protein